MQLENELAILKVKVDEQEKRIEAKQETIDSLKTALKLLEYRQEKTEATPPTGFWSGFKKLFR